MADEGTTRSRDNTFGDQFPPARDAPSGIYANLVRVGYTPTELVLDFCHLTPAFDGQPQPAKIASRVVLPPQVAAQLLLLLRDAVASYGRDAGSRNRPD